MNLKDVLGENYREDMTLADVESALSGLDLVDRAEATKGMIAKDKFDKAVSDLNAKKKQLEARLTDEEKAKLDRDEQDKAVQEELKELRHDKAVNQQLTQLLALGYPDELARDTAAAMVDGDFAKVYANQRTFLENRDKAQMKKQTMASDKRPPAGDTTDSNNFLKLADDAAKQGNTTLQAYYIRRAQENR